MAVHTAPISVLDGRQVPAAPISFLLAVKNVTIVSGDVTLYDL